MGSLPSLRQAIPFQGGGVVRYDPGTDFLGHDILQKHPELRAAYSHYLPELTPEWDAWQNAQPYQQGGVTPESYPAKPLPVPPIDLYPLVKQGPKWVRDKWDQVMAKFAAATMGKVGGVEEKQYGGMVREQNQMPPIMPGSTDTQPAMLTPGEMVLTEEQQKAVRPIKGKAKKLRPEQRAAFKRLLPTKKRG
jgi:hypothetical protein